MYNGIEMVAIAKGTRIRISNEFFAMIAVFKDELHLLL